MKPEPLVVGAVNGFGCWFMSGAGLIVGAIPGAIVDAPRIGVVTVLGAAGGWLVGIRAVHRLPAFVARGRMNASPALHAAVALFAHMACGAVILSPVPIADRGTSALVAALTCALLGGAALLRPTVADARAD